MECSYCKGLGQFYRIKPSMNPDDSTMDFDGIIGAECPECSGTGELSDLSELSLDNLKVRGQKAN